MTRPGLVGRDAELAALAAVLHDIEHRGGAVLVRGDPGVGKTSILRAAGELAAQAGLTVLTTTGVQAESALPYAALHYLLRPLLGGVDALPAAQRDALRTAFGLAEGPATELFLIAQAAHDLVRASAMDRPLVAVVDDVQWLDAPTIEVLSFVARRLSRVPMVLVGAVRGGHDVGALAPDLLVIDVRGLDDDASRQVLSATATGLTAADREVILDQARGNPLALTELPDAWRSARESPAASVGTVMSLSGRLERAFASRVTGLPGPARDALLVAAISSEDDLGEILAATTLLSGTEVTAAALGPAERAGILHVQDGARVGFRHPLVRSGVLQAETLGRRQAAHDALGRVLADQPYRRAWHRAHAALGSDDSVADDLDASHVESVRRGSIVTAIAALEWSAQLTTDSRTRGRRLLLAAQHAFGLGRADLVDHLVRAAARNELSELDQARIEYLREIFDDGAPGDARRVTELSAIAERSAAAGDLDLALDLLLGAALRCWWADTGADARARVVATIEALPASQDDPRCIAAVAVAEPLLRGTQTVRRLAAIGPMADADAEQLRLLGIAARVVGDEPHAADFFARAESRLREQGRLGLLSHVLAVQAAAHVDLGAWRRAAECVDEGLQLAIDTRQPNWSTGITAVEAMVAALTGDTERALRRAAEVELASSSRVINDVLCNAQLARGFALITTGRHGEAYAALRRVFDPADPHHHPREQLSGVMFLAEAAARCDELDDAREVVARMEALARVTVSPVLATQLLYARAVLADDDTAEGLFRAGLGHDLTRWPWTRARILLAYGCWLRRRRRVAESRAPLSAALVTFELIGAPAWVEQARAELRATGVRDDVRDAGPDEGPDDGRSLLSAQELRIATLAATGLSNREIGQQLYLSPRTVGSHLYRVFPKLGVTTRVQLAERLGQAAPGR